MRAEVLDAPGTALRGAELPVPEPGAGEILVEVRACAVCRTDLHVVDGELSRPKLPLVPGHQIAGADAATGERVGVPWLGWTCGDCRFCRSGRENLCARARFTGCDIDGGFAEYAVADERFCFPLPDGFERALGVRPLLIRSGGTLPMVPALAAKGVPAIVTGFALAESNVHSPNERLLAEYVPLGIAAAKELFVSLAALR